MVSTCRLAFLSLLLSVSDPSITTAGAASSSSSKTVDCSGLRSNPIKLANGNLVMHAIVNPVENTLTAELVYSGLAWVSLGFAPGYQTMIGSQAVIGWPSDALSLTNPGKYDMTAEQESGVTLMANSRQTLTNATIEQTGSQTTLRFTKLLAESSENSISSTSKTWFVWAIGGDNSAKYHAQRGGFSVLLDQCLVTEGGVVTNAGSQNNGSVEIPVENDYRSLWMAHGATAATAWAILVPLAVASALIRNLLETAGLPKGIWFQIHRGLNTLAALLTIVSFSIAVYIFNQGTDPVHFTELPHHTVGLVIFILTLLQALNGIFRPHLPHSQEPVLKADDDEEDVHEEPKAASAHAAEKSTTRIIWEFGHRILGVALLAMAWWQVQDGFKLYEERFPADNDLTPAFWGVVVGIGVFTVILVIIQKFVIKGTR